MTGPRDVQRKICVVTCGYVAGITRNDASVVGFQRQQEMFLTPIGLTA
jgi:hypothetical protein